MVDSGRSVDEKVVLRSFKTMTGELRMGPDHYPLLVCLLSSRWDQIIKHISCDW